MAEVLVIWDENANAIRIVGATNSVTRALVTGAAGTFQLFHYDTPTPVLVDGVDWPIPTTEQEPGTYTAVLPAEADLEPGLYRGRLTLTGTNPGEAATWEPVIRVKRRER